MFNPQKHNTLITLQSLTQTKDAHGGNIEAWADVESVWAAVRNFSGNERRATDHGGQVSEARTEFEIDYLAGVAPLMRVSYGGAYYNIRYVNNVNELNRWMILTCETGVNDG